MLDYVLSKGAICAVGQIQIRLLSVCCSYVVILKDIHVSQQVRFDKCNQGMDITCVYLSAGLN